MMTLASVRLANSSMFSSSSRSRPLKDSTNGFSHGGGNLAGPNREERRKLERQSAQAAQAAYERNVTDWHHQQQQRGKKTTVRA
jgi:hypothetical protein